MLLVQFKQADGARRVGVLEDEGRQIRVVEGFATTYDLAQAAISRRSSLSSLVETALGTTVLEYATVARAGRLLAPLDHSDAAHCYVTGTGLTHLGSADGRDAMHKKVNDVDNLTDSMRMFRMGLEGGKPAAGEIGVQPEWFYKGDGSIVCAGEQPLTMPHFALDGGEEPEIAALYVIGPDGAPYRLGFAIGNEFSDHVTERQNYLYLAHSKLRVCAVGPALLVGDLPPHVEGMSRIRDKDGQVRWEKPFVSGEQNMSHTVANLEYHHFKYPLFQRPGDVHIHFFGTATLSCSDGIQVAPGETFEIDVAAFGPPLRNRLAVQQLPVPVIHQL
ncbi:fumarylacetoacetate (FAA) hydrolase family protein [Collimonas arenae]|uniref:Fumarylacetoacetate (FAA) hydrolase family protein n=1 Tax=Collimonas arenae TaxID=279058 RepID=A0A127QM10_9BURK|nr:AraD1 family protein [Collimonas arenae]AMP10865.1 fumarylacetoacetate (FAA) hydrolase family protein [Collimonas arenae]